MRISVNKILKIASLGLLLAGMIDVTATYAEESKKAETKESTIFSGTYNGKQVIPNTMAIFCQMNGAVMVGEEKATINKKEVSGATAIQACLKKILKKMMNADPQTRDEGNKDWKTITQEQIIQLTPETLAKSVVVNDYAKNQETMEASEISFKDDHSDSGGHAAVTANMTDVINSLRSLYAEELKYTVLSTLSSVTYIPVDEDDAEEDKKDNKDDKK